MIDSEALPEAPEDEEWPESSELDLLVLRILRLSPRPILIPSRGGFPRRARRNDASLLRCRDALLLHYQGPPEGEFWSLINRFDELAEERRRDPSRIKRYSLAHRILLAAAQILKEQKEGPNG